MQQDPLMEVRAALLTTTNTGGQLNSSYGGVEIQQKIDLMIADVINRGVDLRPLVTRKPLDQLNLHWNVRTDLGSTNKAAFYAEGTAGTPYPSTKRELHATALALRADYE